MKIEKLNKDNIKEFIRDMKLDNAEDLELNVDKSELFAIKNDDIFCLAFDSLSQVDTIAILYYSPKLSNELFYECINFLNRSLVVENHLIIEVYDNKYMKLLDDKYKCKDILVTLNLSKENFEYKNIISEKTMKEKFIDIEMKSIKYNFLKDIVLCNLVKQNIQDEKMINDLHDYFVKSNVNSVNFVSYPDNFEYFKELGYDCFSRSYVIRNDLF